METQCYLLTTITVVNAKSLTRTSGVRMALITHLLRVIATYPVLCVTVSLTCVTQASRIQLDSHHATIKPLTKHKLFRHTEPS